VFLWQLVQDGLQDDFQLINYYFRLRRKFILFTARCMHCIQRGLATRKRTVRLYVRPSVRLQSVRLSKEIFVTKRKKVVPKLLYHMKDHFILV